MLKKINILIILILFEKGTTMDLVDSVQTKLAFDDTTFFSLTNEDIERLSWSSIPEFTGIVLSSPEKINIHEQSTFPVVIASGYDGIRNARIPEERNLIAVVMNNYGKYFIGPAKYSQKTVKYQAPVPDNQIDSSLAEILHSGCKLYDLQKSLDLDLLPGRYQTLILYFDWISNLQFTEISGQDSDISDQSIEASSVEVTVPLKLSSESKGYLISISLPDIVKLSNDEIILNVKCSIPIENNTIKEINGELVAKRTMTLFFIKRNQDDRPVASLNFNLTSKVEDSKVDNSMRPVLEGNLSVNIAQHLSDLLYESQEYACYLVTWGLHSEPVMMRTVH